MIRVESGIEIPKKGGGRVKKPVKQLKHQFPFVAMENGDSFFVTGDAKKQAIVMAYARAWAKRDGNGHKFTSRMTVNGKRKGVRCWRIA